MKKLLLLFPLLFGCSYNSKLVESNRYLFIRNGLPDTLKVQVVSPDHNGRLSVVVPPRDSVCTRYPFRGGVRAVLIASTKDDLRTYDKRLEDYPGLDWFLVATDMNPPADDVCLKR